MMQPQTTFAANLVISLPDLQRCVIALSLAAAAIWGTHRGRASNYRAPISTGLPDTALDVVRIRLRWIVQFLA